MTRIRPTAEPGPSLEAFGFSYLSGPETPFVRLHQHDELEVGCPHGGEIIAMFGARTIRLPPGQLVVFWATQPHGPIAVSSGVRSSVIHIPTAWFLDWNLPAGFMHSLLRGEVLLCPPRAGGLADGRLIKHWVGLMRQGTEPFRRVVLLEVEARLRQFAAEASPQPAAEISTSEVDLLPGQSPQFCRIVSMVARRYHDSVSAGEIAEELGFHPNYLMRLFRQLTGMSLMEYITRQRVTHAQRLLATTNLKIIDVAMESGFGSVCRFHTVFAKLCGTTPRQYRVNLRSGYPQFLPLPSSTLH